MHTNESRLETRVGTVVLRSPLIVASGTWPHQPNFWKDPLARGIGAACTKAITQSPREGNPGVRLWETPCGLLNSIGLQNPGVEHFLREELDAISTGDVKILANVAMETEEETGLVLDALAREQHRLAVVELNISCPNVDSGGMAWGCEPATASRAVRLAREHWDGPLWVKLTPQCTDIASVARSAEKSGADALVVANTWLGMAMDTRRERPVFSRKVAGLSGPSVFPLSLRLVWEVSSAVKLPVVGCGGISSSEDVLSMLLAGATAVEIGTYHFTNLGCFAAMGQGLLEHMGTKGYASLEEMIGKGKEIDG